MKKLVLLLVLLPSLAFGAPFLVCDAPPAEQQITGYEIYVDGVWFASPVGEVLNYDLVGMEPGQYTFTAKACNIWGCSAESDPILSPMSPTTPSNGRLVP